MVSYSARDAEGTKKGEGGGSGGGEKRGDTAVEEAHTKIRPVALARSACEEKRGRSGNLRRM